MECPICLSEIDYTHTTLCNHIFCVNCIYHWLQNHNTCPLCRRTLISLHPICEEEDYSDDFSLDSDDLEIEDYRREISEIRNNLREMYLMIRIMRIMYS